MKKGSCPKACIGNFEKLSNVQNNARLLVQIAL